MKKITAYKFFRKNIIFFILPIIPLIEGLFYFPVGSVKVIGNTFPFIQGIILLYLVFTKRIKSNGITGFLIILILINTLLLVPFYENISFVLVITLSYYLTNYKNIYTLYEKLNIFVISYFFVTVLIYFFRLNEYAFDLIRTRGGSNIYGSNELPGLLLLLFSFSYYSNQINKKISIVYLFLFLLLSIFFIRRISLIISALLILLVILTHLNYVFKRKIFKISLITFIMSISTYMIINKFDFTEGIINRFSSASNKTNSFNSFVENTSALRLELWSDGISLFEKNMLYGIGNGNFVNFSFHSNAHSLFINNLAEFGLFLGGFINLIYILPLFKILITKNKTGNKLLSFISYVSFLVLANISGVNFFQNTGYVSAFSTLGFFFILKFLYNTRNEAKQSI